MPMQGRFQAAQIIVIKKQKINSYLNELNTDIYNTVPQFIIAKIWKQLRYPLVDEYYIMKYYTVLKRNEQSNHENA